MSNACSGAPRSINPGRSNPREGRQLNGLIATLSRGKSLGPSVSQPNPGATMSNLQKIQAFFTAYAAKNVAGVREVMASDISWTIPGHHPLAGTKRGIDEVLAFFDQLGKANFKAQPLVVAENGDYVIDHHRGWSEEAGGLDLTWCLVFRFEGGKIKEVVNFCADQHLADLFFWKVYQLKPIPDRLA
ncbi:MAG: nuclear transport factor 2 family protein [Ramlibacter sp.]|nr:nuclear transport factor 2 family protein [Ramlibacter sp.]